MKELPPKPEDLKPPETQAGKADGALAGEIPKPGEKPAYPQETPQKLPPGVPSDDWLLNLIVESNLKHHESPPKPVIDEKDRLR